MNFIDFLSAFYPDKNETVCIRAFAPKDAAKTLHNRAKKVETSVAKLSTEDGLSDLRSLNQHCGIYFAPNAGGHTDNAIRRFNAVFVESDDMTIKEQNAALDAAPLQTSIRVETKRSVHAYWLLEEGVTADEWKGAQQRAIRYFKSDPSIKNPSRVMRLPGFLHLFYDRASAKCETTLVKITQLDLGVRYPVRELLTRFGDMTNNSHLSACADVNDRIIGHGRRNTELFKIAVRLSQNGLTEADLLETLNGLNTSRVRPPLDKAEIATLARNAVRYSAGGIVEVRDERDVDILVPALAEKALYGPAGDFVRTIEPHTEAHPAALLIQLLAGFGCMLGKGAYFLAESDMHFTKLFAVLVGASSKGRKGTSSGRVCAVLTRVDETFRDCIQDGLSSGEGLIYHVRDSRMKKSPIKEKGGRITDYQEEVDDEGASEKRLLVLEPEFARVLKVMQREGNTLSSLIRQAWDSDQLRVLTKTPLKASETHISIIGHITIPELRRNLSETDLVNGFANRFLWVYTRRTKELPFGGDLNASDLNGLVRDLHSAMEFGREVGELKRDSEARDLWAAEYSRLSSGGLDLVSSVTSRAEPQVMRIACLFAVLDRSRCITRPHLEAALAVWNYTRDSAQYIFGEDTGDKTADTIFKQLVYRPEGMTRTEIRDLFQRNAASGQITNALKLLVDLGRISVGSVKTGGRSTQIFFSRSNDTNDQSSENPTVVV